MLDVKNEALVKNLVKNLNTGKCRHGLLDLDHSWSATDALKTNSKKYL